MKIYSVRKEFLFIFLFVACKPYPCPVSIQEAFLKLRTPSILSTGWKAKLRVASSRAMETHKPILFLEKEKNAPRFEKKISENLFTSFQNFAWHTIITRLSLVLGYKEPEEYPYEALLTLKSPPLTGKGEILLQSGHEIILGLPTGHAFLLQCVRGKSSVLIYNTGYANMTDFERIFVTVLQGISTYFTQTLKLPESWGEVVKMRTNLWLLPPPYQTDPDAAFLIRRERNHLTLTWFPGSENEFTTHIQVMGIEKKGRHSLEADRITDSALSLTVHLVIFPMAYSQKPQITSGTSLRKLAEQVAPVNRDAFLWEHLASDKVLSGSEAREVHSALKSGQVLLTLQGKLLEFSAYYLQTRVDGKPGEEGFAIGLF